VFFLSIYPFIINIFYSKPNLDQYKDELLKEGTLLITGLSFPDPELIWIFPKIIILLFFSIFSILYIKRNFRIEFPIIVILLYMLQSLLSSIFSDDSVQYILLGGNGRMDGLIYIFSLSILFIFSYLLIRYYDFKAANLFIFSLIFSTFLESSIVYLQRLGYDVIGLLTVGMQYPLITGTVGNSGMVAALLLPTIILILSMLIYNKYNIYIYILYILLLIYIVGAISLTNNRASIYSILIISMIIFLFNYKYIKTYIVLIILLITIGFTPIIIPNYTQTKTRSMTNPSTLITRLAIWNITFKIITQTKGQPFIGNGFDGLKMGIIKNKLGNEYINLYRLEDGWPETVQISELRWLHENGLSIKTDALLVYATDSVTGKSYSGVYKVVLDKAHNLFLDKAVSTGILSAVLWIILFIWPIWQGFLIKNNTLMSFTLSIFALLLYYQFWFPVPQVEPIHIVILAISWGLVYNRYFNLNTN